MTLTDSPDGSDFSPEESELSLVSNLSVGAPGALIPDAPTPAAQGDAPADLESRETPEVPTPSRDGLSAAELARLTGQDAETVSANDDLDRAEGVVPDSED